MVTVDLALYEVVNVVWRHQFMVKDVGDTYGSRGSGRIRAIRPGEGLMRRGHASARKSRSIYDTIFIALALDFASDLATFDRRQAELPQKETGT
jgi:predicted nucleic acid-binding protein